MVRQQWICKGVNVLAPSTENRFIEYKVNAKSVDEAKRKAFLKFKIDFPKGYLLIRLIKRTNA